MFLNKIKANLGVLLVLTVLCAIGTAVGLGQQDSATKKPEPEAKKAELEVRTEQEMLGRLQGTWTCIYMHQDGMKQEPAYSFTINGNSWDGKQDGQMQQSGTIKFVDLHGSPRQCDLLITFSISEEERGKTRALAFMLDGDLLSTSTCWPDKKPRPQAFVTQEGDGYCVCLFKRVAAREKK